MGVEGRYLKWDAAAAYDHTTHPVAWPITKGTVVGRVHIRDNKHIPTLFTAPGTVLSYSPPNNLATVTWVDNTTSRGRTQATLAAVAAPSPSFSPGFLVAEACRGLSYSPPTPGVRWVTKTIQGAHLELESRLLVIELAPVDGVPTRAVA